MIYTNLKEYLEDKKLSQRALARQLSISPSYLNALVAGTRRPSPELAAEIERITGIPFRVLLLTDRVQPEKAAIA